MKHSTLLALALAGLAFVAAGCTTFRKPAAASRAPTFALVVSINGGQAPTDAQWAALQKRFAAALAANGYVLISDASLADNVIHVQFFPDPADPTLGTAYVVSVRPNVLTQVTTYAGTRALSYTYGSSYSGFPGYSYNDYPSDYFGYYPASGGIYVTKPYTPPPTPPNANKPDHRRHPGDNPPGHRPPPNYAGGDRPSHPPPSDGDRPPRRRPGTDDSGPGYSGSPSYLPPAYSSSAGSSSGYVGPTTSYSSSSSSSAPAISMPSSSSYEASSSSSAPSSTYSAPAYSPPADSGGGRSDTAVQKQPN
jgi:hypothetical protein